MKANMNKIILAAIGACAIFASQFPAGAQAQQVPGRSTTATPTIQATAVAAATQKNEWVLTPDQDTVRVPLNKVVSVRLMGTVANVVIANPDIADVILPEDGERSHVYVLARQVGSTTIVFEDANGKILFQGDVQVDVDVAGIQAAIKEILPEEKINVVAHRNSVFIKGFVRSAVASNSAVNVARKFVTDPLDIINGLEVLGSQQVVMQVRVAEIQRTALKGLGVDLGLDGNFAGLSGNSTGSGFTTTLGQGPAAVLNSVGNRIPGLSSISIKALEKQGFAKTLAEPSLTAMSGETASFLAGGSFPMPTGYDATSNMITFEQTPFGVALNFTPVVMDKGRISLRVKTTVSDRDNDSGTTLGAIGVMPGLKEKTTETTVELPSGGSLLMSGLIQNDMLNYVEGIPGLMNIPVLGQLFRSEGFKNKETELVVLVTAYLAQPTSNAQGLAMPTDGFSPSGDLDFYLLGRLHKLYANKELPPYATPLTGPYGYIME